MKDGSISRRSIQKPAKRDIRPGPEAKILVWIDVFGAPLQRDCAHTGRPRVVYDGRRDTPPDRCQAAIELAWPVVRDDHDVDRAHPHARVRAP